jgi:hypothetical protein
MSDCGTPAGDTFYGPGGHYDVRGRKAVRKAIEEEEKDRRAREMSAGKSRLELAEEAAKRRHGMRQILPNQDEVSVPWLFDQVVSELEVEDKSVYHSAKEDKNNKIESEDYDFFFKEEEEIDSNIPWWKKRKETKIIATLHDMFDVIEGEGEHDEENTEDQEGVERNDDYNGKNIENRYTGGSKSPKSPKSPNKRKQFTPKQVYQHRYSKERIHDFQSNIYSDIDKAASMMELREAVVKQNKRMSQHPKRDSKKRIVANPYAVGSDERMYKYHYWGDRSINISEPTGDILHVVRDDLKEHVNERVQRKELLKKEVTLLEDDLILAKNTKKNIKQRFDERKMRLQNQINESKKWEAKIAEAESLLKREKENTRKHVFRNAQAEIMLHRAHARYLVEPQLHKCIRAFFWRCCNTGKTCWGKKTEDPEYKGCCFHCCSTCWCKGCVNKYDVDTTLEEMRHKKGNTPPRFFFFFFFFF